MEDRMYTYTTPTITCTAYKGVKGNTFVDDLYKEVMDLPLKNRRTQ